MRPVRLHLVAFLDLRVVAQQHRADLVFFQVHGDAGDIVRELDQFARHDFFQAMNSAMPSPTEITDPVSVTSIARS